MMIGYLNPWGKGLGTTSIVASTVLFGLASSSTLLRFSTPVELLRLRARGRRAEGPGF